MVSNCLTGQMGVQMDESGHMKKAMDLQRQARYAFSILPLQK